MFLPNVTSFLEWAKPLFKLAIVTAGSRTSLNIGLKKLGYFDFFDKIVTAEDVLKSKPNPECYFRAQRLFNCRKEEILIFEDSENGLLAAKASGMDYLNVANKSFSWLNFVSQ